MDLICQKGRGGVLRKRKMTGGVKYLSPPDFKVFDQFKYFSPLFQGSCIYFSRVCVQESLSENQRGHL